MDRKLDKNIRIPYTAKRLKDKIKDTEKTVSHRTIEKELNYLSAMCRYMHQQGLAVKMPIIPKPPKAKLNLKIFNNR